MSEELTINSLKEMPNNPRRISREALEGLKASLKRFGDISGIVWNRRTGHLVCGHQRVEQLKRIWGSNRLRFVLDGEWGRVETPEGRYFRVRIVDWSEEEEYLANITANNPYLMGAFDEVQLRELLDRIGGETEGLRLERLISDFEWDVGSEVDYSEETDYVSIVISGIEDARIDIIVRWLTECLADCDWFLGVEVQ